MITLRKHDSRYYYDLFFRFLSKCGFRFNYKINDHLVQYDPVASGIGHRIFFDGGFEDRELHLVSRYIQKNSIVFDIGANIGTHSIFFSTIATEGKIYTFEPSKSTYTLLLKNIINYQNIIPVNLGLSDTSKESNFFECEDNALSGLKDTKRSKIKQISTILTVSGDQFQELYGITHVDFIKIDVEGLEQSVIKGLSRVISRFHPTIFCEIYQGVNSNSSPRQTIELILSFGYKAFILTDPGLMPYRGVHDDTNSNYLFVADLHT
jgi:FkbM family methyltransferase